MAGTIDQGKDDFADGRNLLPCVAERRAVVILQLAEGGLHPPPQVIQLLEVGHWELRLGQIRQQHLIRVLGKFQPDEPEPANE